MTPSRPAFAALLCLALALPGLTRADQAAETHPAPVAAAETAAAPEPVVLTEAQAEQLAQAEAFVTRAIAEHRRFQTCLSLLPRDLDGSVQIWNRMAAEAAAVLAEQPGTEALIATLNTSALPGALLPAPETPFIEVRTLCLADPDWHRRMMLFDFLQLPAALDHVFQD